MIKIAVASMEEISDPEKNPTGCLSALRYTGACTKCAVFERALKLKQSPNCRPIIHEDALRHIRASERAQAEKAVRRAKQRIKTLEKIVEDSKSVILTG